MSGRGIRRASRLLAAARGPAARRLCTAPFFCNNAGGARRSGHGRASCRARLSTLFFSKTLRPTSAPGPWGSMGGPAVGHSRGQTHRSPPPPYRCPYPCPYCTLTPSLPPPPFSIRPVHVFPNPPAFPRPSRARQTAERSAAARGGAAGLTASGGPSTAPIASPSPRFFCRWSRRSLFPAPKGVTSEACFLRRKGSRGRAGPGRARRRQRRAGRTAHRPRPPAAS